MPVNFKRMLASLVVSASLLGCTMRGCTSSDDIAPEDQLHSYINLAVNITRAEQREELVGLTAGELRTAISSATEETFRRAYIEKKYDFKSFEIIQRRDVPGKKELQVDFKLVYKSWNAGEAPERAPLIETTNRATMVYEHGRWAIAKVESLGSNFEWEVGIPMDDVSTKDVTPEDSPKEIESSREIPADTPSDDQAPESGANGASPSQEPSSSSTPGVTP